MAHVVRLVLCALALVSAAAFAVIKPVGSTVWVSTSGGAGAGVQFKSMEACMAIHEAYIQENFGSRLGKDLFKVPQSVTGVAPSRTASVGLSYSSGGSPFLVRSCLEKPGPQTCPDNSYQNGAECACSPGYKEFNGQCVKDGVCGFLEGKPVPGLPRIEADYGPQSASWAAGKIGGKGLVCTPEQCQASGTVTGCVAGQGAQGTTVCYVSDPKYTGDSCKKDDKPGDKTDKCPPGTKQSATNPALCEPLDTKCPEGYEPSKYAEGVCIPVDPASGPKECEDPNDPTKKIPCEGKPNECPKGYVPSKYVKNVCIPAEDGEGTDKNGDKVTCKDGVCTTTKPDGTSTSKPKGEFCAENPNNELCTKKSDDSFSGTCDINFSCKGDVLQCAIAQEQHRRNCQFFVTPTPESRIFDNARAKSQEDVLSMTAQTVDLAAHINADPIVTGSCPADVVTTVANHEIRLPMSQFCPYFNYLGLIVMAMTAVTCLRILGKD